MALEISPSKSLFGRYPYLKEQIMIIKFAEEVDSATAFIKPMAVSPFLEFLEKVPIETRLKKSREHLIKAKKILDDIGV